MVDTTYLGKTLSDHNPLEVVLTWGRIPIPTWKLNPSLLEDSVFHSTLNTAIINYFAEKANTTSSRQIEWDAFKTVLRGAAISRRVGECTTLLTSLTDVENRLGALEREVLANDVRKEDLQEAHIRHAELLEDLRILDYRLYTQRQNAEADRAGPLLARIIQNTQDATPILEVTNSEGVLVNTHLDINDAFNSYYEALYAVTPVLPEHKFDSFFRDLQFPQVLEENKAELAKPITEAEIRAAIRALPRNKTPVSDGVPAEFYATYTTILVPHLKQLYQSSLEAGTLPNTTLQALVVSLLKPDRTGTDMAGYRPLSLLNTDYKILSKLLAARIQQLIPHLIHIDQNGFVPGRSTALNIRRLHQLMTKASLHEGTHGCISLDMRQVFDSLNWEYMFRILPKYGIPDQYIKWMALLYANPTARAHTGSHISSPYAVARGTR